MDDSATILVVDDDADMRSMACEVLNLLGFCTADCASADAALVWMRSGQADVVLTDVSLEDGQGAGLSLCAQLRREFPRTKVHVITGDSTARRAATRAGAHEFWVKPVDLAQVATALPLPERHRA